VAGTLTGTLVIGFLSGLHLNYLAPVVTAFKKAQPQVTLDFFHGVNAQQLKALREGRLDVGFIMLPAQLEGYSQEVVWRVPFKVVLPKKHPLAGQRSFELGDLRNEDFVFCTRESRPQFYDEFFRQCVNAGFRPRVVQEVGGYPTNMLGLISVGSGVGVLPHFRGVERLQGIVWRDLIKPKMWNDYALVWRRTATSRVVEKFVSTAREIFPTPKEDDWAEP
jgi:DNA-binding transcriptional LysR family regulator